MRLLPGAPGRRGAGAHDRGTHGTAGHASGPGRVTGRGWAGAGWPRPIVACGQCGDRAVDNGRTMPADAVDNVRGWVWPVDGAGDTVDNGSGEWGYPVDRELGHPHSVHRVVGNPATIAEMQGIGLWIASDFHRGCGQPCG